MTVQERAEQATEYFKTVFRAEDGSDYVRLRDGRPDWVYEMARAAHGDILPDDWRYRLIESVLHEIADGDAEGSGEIGGQVAESWGIYTADLLSWVGSHLSRIAYVDEWREQIGAGQSITDDLHGGLYVECVEIANLILRFLEDMEDDEAN